jgi:hypothetical protein
LIAHGAAELVEDPALVVLDDGVLPAVAEALLLAGGDVDLWVLARVEPPAPAAGLGLLEPIAFSVSVMRTMTSTIEPMRISRRRQYTDGGWAPTG